MFFLMRWRPTTETQHNAFRAHYRLIPIYVVGIAYLVSFNLHCLTGSSISSVVVKRIPHTNPIFGSNLTPRFSRPQNLWLSTSTLESHSRPGIDEDVDGRNDWFTFQRTYPSNTIPADARLRAWRETPRYQIDSPMVPQAATTWRAIGPSPTFSAWLQFW